MTEEILTGLKSQGVVDIANVTVMMPRITQHFTIQVDTMSIGKHSDMD